MSNVIIGGSATGATPLPTASTIDPVSDYVPIYTAGVTATQAINRNTYLGLTSAPVSINDVQTLTNKTLGITNIATLKDANFTLDQTTDNTKQLRFNLSAITSGNMRTLTIPDTSDTIVTLAATQTLTNKTLTTPTINSPTITNAALSADTITGYTTSNAGTIYGIPVASGKINASYLTNNSITTTQIATNAVAASQLATNAITLGCAQSSNPFNTSSPTPVLITGCSVGVTIPSGTRNVKVTFFANTFSVMAGGNASVYLFSGASSGTLTTQINQSTYGTANVDNGNILVMAYLSAPAAGSIYFSAALSNSASDSTTISVSAVCPMFILVEAI
jgi:hypothetical protein